MAFKVPTSSEKLSQQKFNLPLGLISNAKCSGVQTPRLVVAQLLYKPGVADGLV